MSCRRPAVTRLQAPSPVSPVSNVGAARAVLSMSRADKTRQTVLLLVVIPAKSGNPGTARPQRLSPDPRFRVAFAGVTITLMETDLISGQALKGAGWKCHPADADH
jgi:hypothetical protein